MGGILVFEESAWLARLSSFLTEEFLLLVHQKLCEPLSLGCICLWVAVSICRMAHTVLQTFLISDIEILDLDLSVIFLRALNWSRWSLHLAEFLIVNVRLSESDMLFHHLSRKPCGISIQKFLSLWNSPKTRGVGYPFDQPLMLLSQIFPLGLPASFDSSLAVPQHGSWGYPYHIDIFSFCGSVHLVRGLSFLAPGSSLLDYLFNSGDDV